MKRVLIADAVRTPWGKPGKSLERFLSSDLSAPLLKELLNRTGVAPEAVDQVVFGQAHPSTYPNNIGHYAWLKAELPVEVPGYTVQANTASALQSLRNAYYLIASGNEGLCIAGGADSYSAAPFVMRDVRNHFYPQHRVVIDSLDEAEQCTQPQPMTRKAQYEAAYGTALSEEDAAFMACSREKAARYAASAGDIVSLSYTDRKKGEIVISADEWLSSPSEDALAPYADGAAVMMLIGEDKAAELGVTAKAELLGFAVAGCDPKNPQAAGAPAIRKLLERKGLTLEDVAVLEIIENSAEDVLATVAALGTDLPVNPMGGALAFGKNDGAEGIFMVQRLVEALKSGETGIACVYSAGGQSMAALVKKL